MKNPFKTVSDMLDVFYSKNEQTEIIKLKEDLSSIEMQLFNANSKLNEQDHIMDGMEDKIEDLESLVPYVSETEKYYNNKLPKINVTYSREETDSSYEIDVRNFFMLNDHKLPVVTGSNCDDKALNALKKVHSMIKYDADTKTYSFGEYWAYTYQTLMRKLGDCEDGAILIANIMVKSGVPYWRVRLNAGTVWDGRSTAGFLKMVDTNIYGDETCRLKKEIDFGTIQEVKQQELKKDKDSINQRNLKKALFLGTKEQEETESLFVNMVGKQLKPDQEFVKNVEQLIKKENYTFITGIKIDSTMFQKIYKYYVALAIVDTMEEKGMLDNSEKEQYHGTKDSNLNNTSGGAGHAYVTYCRESDDEFVVLDWCYWYNTKLIKDRPTHKEERNYIDKERNFHVWFSWNTKYCFGKSFVDIKAAQGELPVKSNRFKKVSGNQNINKPLAPKVLIGDNMGDIKITAWKGLKVFVFAAIPAGLGALLGVPELITFSPIIAGVIEAFNNWRKHRN